MHRIARRQFHALALSPALAALPAARAQGAGALPPASAFFDSEVFSGATLSPDGRRVAFLSGGKDRRLQLGVIELQSMQPRMVAAFKDADIGRVAWVGDTRLVFDLSVTLTGPGLADRGQGLFGVNADGSDLRQLVRTTRVFVTAGDADPDLLPWFMSLHTVPARRDDDSVIVVGVEGVEGKEASHLSVRRIETRRGRGREMEVPTHTKELLFDRRGEPRVVVTARGNERQVQWRNPQGAWEVIDRSSRFDNVYFQPLLVDAEDRLWVSSRGADGFDVLHTYDPAARRRSDKPALALAGFDVRPEFVQTHDKLLGVRTVTDAEVTVWFDPAMKALQEWLDQRLPGTTNRISVPWRAATPWLLVESESDRDPPQTLLLHAETRRLVRLGSAHPQLQPAQLGRMDFHRIKARDGLEIPAYLTLPPGAAAGKRLPLVLLVHGGPYVRGWRWGFDAEVQFLASRGYAVLAPEFRGSTGFGDRHFRAGFKQWGLAMQDDLADAVKWAVAQGVADADRVCIAGASYGGYAALMGLVNDPGLYRCAISWVGVTDIGLLFEASWSDLSDAWRTHGMTALIGDPKDDAARFASTSPLRQAARIKAPVLMAYGRYDVRVPLVHGERMRDALRGHGNAPEWVVYDEGHGWQSAETRIDFWTRVERFLARHLGPGAR